MPRTPAARYFESREAYFTTFQGKPHCVASGPRGEPDGLTYRATVPKSSEVIHVAEAARADRATLQKPRRPPLDGRPCLPHAKANAEACQSMMLRCSTTGPAERYANVRPEARERLERLGLERALIYKTLVLTGLRKGELESLTVAHLHLDEAIPFAVLDAADEKNREGNEIPLRDDLAADLRDWLAGKLVVLQSEAIRLHQLLTMPHKRCLFLTDCSPLNQRFRTALPSS